MAIYILLMLIASSAYGLVSPILRDAYQAGLDVNTATDVQYVLAVVVLWIVVLFRRRGKPVQGAQWLLILGVGLANAVFCYAYYQALTVLPASIGIVFMFQFVWMTMVIDIIVKRRLPEWPKWIGLILILAGTVLSVGIEPGAWHAIPWWAAGLGLLAALSYACTLYLSGYYDPDVSSELRSALVMTVATVFIFFVFPPSDMMRSFVAHPARTVYWGGWIALLSQVLPTLLVLAAIPHIGGRMAGVLGTLELPVAVFGAWLMNGDHVTWSRWIGVVLILCGIVISEAIRSRRQAFRTSNDARKPPSYASGSRSK
ncbi:EamA family transporter [Alicyclobacillus acidiphilus]|uniref:EamA family transporter n=1 Tax=Alicyclobacillus acidiphilus TaxID=182455 RepID=UPI00083517A9|nr:DMT family transporter [Alicyclobacillus acidiphilus]